jgi:prepilin-type N-terminal cleavage/methylation domain-containing protein
MQFRRVFLCPKDRRSIASSEKSGDSHGLCLWKRSAQEGVTLVEIIIAIALLGLVATTAIATLMILNKNAVSTRIMTSAREIVQRNIEAAVGPAFAPGSPPANGILNLTSASGAVWDENGGSNPVTIYTSRDGTPTITGTLTRTVLAEPSAVPAPTPDIRRVKFHLDYSLFGRAMSYEMTTLRSVDK